MATATIVCDASHCHKTLAAGYGIWVASDRGKQPFSGPIKGAHDSQVAEVIAMSKGLFHALDNGLVVYGDQILIQTDCLAAIRLYKTNTHRNEKELEAYNQFHAIIAKYKLSVHYRHVQGHSSKMDTRSICQRLCDERAKAAMGLERSRIRITEIKKNVLEPAILARAEGKVGHANATAGSVDEPSKKALWRHRIWQKSLLVSEISNV